MARPVLVASPRDAGLSPAAQVGPRPAAEAGLSPAAQAGPRPAGRRQVRLAGLLLPLVLVLTALFAAACSNGKPPPATPMALSDLVSELVRHRVAVVKTISGDPGCNDADLAPAGVHLLVRMIGQTDLHDVFLFRFKDQATWQSKAGAVARCAATGPTTAAAAAAGTLQTIAVSPFRAFGAGWPTGLQQALDSVVRIAAAGGTNPGAGQPEE